VCRRLSGVGGYLLFESVNLHDRYASRNGTRSESC
jgi:hypothetical protein